jgi:hypothetical protein
MIVPYLPAITISPLLNEQVESVHSVTKPYELTPRPIRHCTAHRTTREPFNSRSSLPNP